MVVENTVEGASNRLFVLDWTTCQSEPLSEPGAGGVVMGPKSRTVYYRWRDALCATDVDRRETRRIGALPRGAQIATVNAAETQMAGTFVTGGPAIAHDGPKSAWFDKTFEAARPQCLFSLDLATGRTNIFYEYPGWLGHIQFSPSDPGLLMFCHEGPWHKLDRIWTIRTDGSGLRLMHRRSMPMEIAGHEFWSPDGQTIWFDLQMPRGERFFLAGVNVATGEETRYPLTRNQWSVHYNISPDSRLFAGDGGGPGMVAHAADGKWIWLFKPQANGTLRAERLVNMSKHDYALEPNVNFTPDGTWIVFRGNFEGTAQVYAVEVAKSGHDPL